MASFRITDQARTFWGQTGQLLAGGSLVFTTAGTTTPVSVYGNLGLTVVNGSTVALDSSGRASVDVWGNTATLYRMRVYDSSSVLQADIDNIQVPGGQAQVIPVPSSGEFVTGDGTNFLKVALRQIPDPTGNANKILGTDGTAVTWVAKPSSGTNGAAGTSDTASASGTFRVGTARAQYGTGSATSTGAKTCTGTVTFPTAFTSTPVVLVTMAAAAPPTSSGAVLPKWDITSTSTTGFTVSFNTHNGGSSSENSGNIDITAAVPFTWVAFGAS
jgi:hypothetical protein